MAPGRTRDDRKERQWQRWIAQWQTSNLSVRDFCARHGLTEANFYAWRRTLTQRAVPPATFVPVQLVPDTSSLPTSPLEVVLANGQTLGVAPGFDAATLRQLLAVLQEGRPC